MEYRCTQVIFALSGAGRFYEEIKGFLKYAWEK